jgi:hypothetical protein
VAIVVGIAVDIKIIVIMVFVVVQISRWSRGNRSAVLLDVGGARRIGSIGGFAALFVAFASATAPTATATLSATVFARFFLLHHAGDFDFREFLLEPFGIVRFVQIQPRLVEISIRFVGQYFIGPARTGDFASFARRSLRLSISTATARTTATASATPPARATILVGFTPFAARSFACKVVIASGFDRFTTKSRAKLILDLRQLLTKVDHGTALPHRLCRSRRLEFINQRAGWRGSVGKS